MTHRNKVVALSGTLALLLLVYAAGLLFAPERRLARTESGRLLSAPSKEALSIDLVPASGPSKGTVPLSFRKEGSAWTCLEQGEILPAQAGRVDAFLKALEAVSRLPRRSDGLAGGQEFGLGDGQGSRLVVKDADGKVMADFTAGGYGPTGKEVYVRLGNAKAIYAVDAGFESYLSSPRASWLDLRVFTAPPKAETIQTLSVESSLPKDALGKAQRPFSWKATRQDGGWVGQSGKEDYDAISVESILRAVQNMTGEDIVARPPVDAFSRIQGRVSLGLGQSGSRIVEVGNEAEGQRYYVRCNGSAWVYLVSAYSLAAVFRPESLVSVKK